MVIFFFFKQKTAYEVRISDWSSDVCSSDLVAIEDHAAFHVAGRAPDGLDQRGFRSEEPLLVGVQDGDQPAFRNVQSLAQQVDADEHVIDAKAQVADQFDALQRLDRKSVE